MTFADGTKVTITPAPGDHEKLRLDPCATIARNLHDGTYLVWYPLEYSGEGKPTRFGPVPAARLTEGWPTLPIRPRNAPADAWSRR